MMKKAQSDAAKILFASLFVVAFFLVTTLMILGTIENTRYDNAYLDWENEANLLIRRFINSKSCVAYEKKEIYYSADEDAIKAYAKTFENTIDLRKLNEQRIKDCLLYGIESSICSDCPRAVFVASGDRCPESYCNGDFYVRKSMEDTGNLADCDTSSDKTIYSCVRKKICPYTSQNNCQYALKTNTFVDIFTSPLNFIGILPCELPPYDAVPCSSDDDGDSLFDEKLTEENRMYIYLQVYEETESGLESKFLLKLNEDYQNTNNYVEFEIPITVREDDYKASSGLLKFGISVDSIYFSSRVI